MTSTMGFDVNPDKFAAFDGERKVCQASLNIVLFANDIDANADVVNAYDAFLAEFESEIKFQRSDLHQMHHRRIVKTRRAETFGKMRSMLTNLSRGAWVELHSGTSRDEWSPPYFRIGVDSRPRRGPGDQGMELSIQIPLQWLERNSVAQVEAFIDRILGDRLPYEHGYVGFGLTWNFCSGRDEARLGPSFYQWLHSHPGLMAPATIAQKTPARYGIVDIGWITLLNQENAVRAGGADGIRDRFGAAYREQLAIRPIANGGIAIKAGPLPQFGAQPICSTLPLQAEVGKALKCIWDDRSAVQVVNGFPRDPDFVDEKAWASRFFAHQDQATMNKA